MAFFRFFFAVTTLVLLHLASIAFASSHGSKQLGDQCSSDEECSVGLGCFKCGIDAARCVRSNITDQFSLVLTEANPNAIYYLLVWADADTWFERQQQEKEILKIQAENKAAMEAAEELHRKKLAQDRQGEMEEDTDVKDDPMARAEAEALSHDNPQ
ncbi:hypothetical protein F2Q68_00013323 [Brassica cretica]|uniref:Uncharacterized protein n=1 Tax=Brassica cretica TaxID=69181 RepID=A0A8S9HLG8_BRACR|nr:hypothetical protein F2Q68_00013323 [Brassica cretica]